MIVLGLDTCLTACSAAVIRDGEVRARAFEVMAKGHQERLAPLVAEVMAQAGVRFSDLDRIGVTLGPGSFTGLRVGLAFAKGLAAALSIPLAGVGALEALAAAAPEGLTFAAVDARRDQIYLQAFEAGEALSAPDAVGLDAAAARLVELSAGRAATLVGSGAALLGAVAPNARIIAAEGPDPVAVARLAAERAPGAARPLYLRPPDARLPGA